MEKINSRAHKDFQATQGLPKNLEGLCVHMRVWQLIFITTAQNLSWQGSQNIIIKNYNKYLTINFCHDQIGGGDVEDIKCRNIISI